MEDQTQQTVFFDFAPIFMSRALDPDKRLQAERAAAEYRFGQHLAIILSRPTDVERTAALAAYRATCAEHYGALLGRHFAAQMEGHVERELALRGGMGGSADEPA